MTLREELQKAWLRYQHEVRINGTLIQTAGPPTITRSLAAVSATATIPVHDWPAVALEGADVQIREALNGIWVTTFVGIVYRPERSDFPTSGTIHAIDQLYLAQFNTETAMTWRLATTAQVITDLLDAAGVTNYNIPETNWVIGMYSEVELAAQRSYYSLIEEIDVMEGYRTLSDAAGVIQRVPLPLYPGQALTAAFRYADNPTVGELGVKSPVNRGGSGVAGIRNRVVVSGTRGTGRVETITAVLDTPVALQYLPHAYSLTARDEDLTVFYNERKDYVVDYEAGTIMFEPTGAAGTGVNVAVDLTYIDVAELEERTWSVVADSPEVHVLPHGAIVEGTLVARYAAIHAPDTRLLYETVGTPDFRVDYLTGNFIALTGGTLESGDQVTVAYSGPALTEETEFEIYRAASNAYLPPGRYVTLNFSNPLVEDTLTAASIAGRLMREHNRTSDALSIPAISNLELRLGQTITYRDDKLGLPEQTPFLVTGITRTGDAMTLRAVGGAGGEEGYLSPLPPVAQFDYHIFAVGTLAILTLDGRFSWDANDDIEEYFWVTGYTWEGEDPPTWSNESVITRTFDTNAEPSLYVSLRVRDATNLESGLYVRTINLLGSDEDVESGRYRSLSIYQVLGWNTIDDNVLPIHQDPPLNAMFMGTNRVYEGMGTAGPLHDSGGPYYHQTRRYGTRKGGLASPIRLASGAFQWGHMIGKVHQWGDNDFLAPGEGVGWNERYYYANGEYHLIGEGHLSQPHKMYVSSFAAQPRLHPFEYQPGSVDSGWYDGEEYPDWAWIDLGPSRGATWQWWDSEIVAFVRQPGGGGVYGVHVEIYSNADTGNGGPPIFISEHYFRYQQIAPVPIFPLNEEYITDDPTVVPWPARVVGLHPILGEQFPERYKPEMGMPERWMAHHFRYSDGNNFYDDIDWLGRDANAYYLYFGNWGINIGDDANLRRFSYGMPIVWFTRETPHVIYLALTWSVYKSTDLGETWETVLSWPDLIYEGWDGDWYRKGYQWGGVCGNEYGDVVVAVGWSAAANTSNIRWSNKETDVTPGMSVFAGHYNPLYFLETGEQPTFIERVDVASMTAVLGTRAFVINGVWWVSYNDVTESWDTAPLVYDDAYEFDVEFDKLIPHPTEANLWVVTNYNGPYRVYIRNGLVMELLGASTAPLPNFIALTDNERLPVETVTVVSDSETVAIGAASDPANWTSLAYNDNAWLPSEEKGE
jgi:hypothetical protein